MSVDKIAQLNVETVTSEFEATIADEIYAWVMNQDITYGNFKDAVVAFWKEKF